MSDPTPLTMALRAVGQAYRRHRDDHGKQPTRVYCSRETLRIMDQLALEAYRKPFMTVVSEAWRRESGPGATHMDANMKFGEVAVS